MYDKITSVDTAHLIEIYGFGIFNFFFLNMVSRGFKKKKFSQTPMGNSLSSHLFEYYSVGWAGV